MSDFSMKAGDTKVIEVAVQDAAGAPVDITGASSVRWQLGKGPGKAPILSKSVGNGIIVADPVAGCFHVSLATGDTEALKGSFYHEAEVILADGTVATVLTGTATIEPTLIKPAA